MRSESEKEDELKVLCIVQMLSGDMKNETENIEWILCDECDVWVRLSCIPQL